MEDNAGAAPQSECRLDSRRRPYFALNHERSASLTCDMGIRYRELDTSGPEREGVDVVSFFLKHGMVPL
jgi:hypothetical protein